MRPLSLTLTGFIGIRDGMNRETLALDFERLTAGAQLVAIVGPNGRGKTTVLDNMTPYATMPSKAGADGLGSFSYYDEVYLPVNRKELLWEMGGQRYRTQIIIRLNGKRRSEAYLHQFRAGAWQPAQLPDGTVSDGRMESYQRCIEDIVGPAATFFTTAFSAQNRRQLAHYRNAEIKTLLSDLLGLERVRTKGLQAAETAKLLRGGLSGLQQERRLLQQQIDDHHALSRQLAVPDGALDTLQCHRKAALAELDEAKNALATLKAEQAVAATYVNQRQQLNQTLQNLRDRMQTRNQQIDEREHDLIAAGQAIIQQILQRRHEHAQEFQAAVSRHANLRLLNADHRRVTRAVHRLPILTRLQEYRSNHAATCRQSHDRYMQATSERALAQQKIDGFNREIGETVCQIRTLHQRLSLTSLVPCAGTALQGQCQLLEHARSARPIIPQHEQSLRRLEHAQRHQTEVLSQLDAQIAAMPDTAERLARALRRLDRTRERRSTNQQVAARASEIEQTRDSIDDVIRRIHLLAQAVDHETDAEKQEKARVDKDLTAIAAERAQIAHGIRIEREHIEQQLSALPLPFDPIRLAQTDQEIVHCAGRLAECETQLHEAIGRQHRLTEIQRQLLAHQQTLALLDARIAHIEEQTAIWSLFATCMGNDGVIALAIDDAGPVLSMLTNDLLMACYGPRFTVSIRTLLESGKGQSREGFDVIVHDANTGFAKSASKMSGGERVWINECLTRAMALYLAESNCRRSETLFSDEADGAFDAEHKRMFLAMKRQVMQLGGYQQEFFISHTPELCDLADVTLNLG
ncbi:MULTISPECIES: AAA family ATPase [unclassified Janthinobacterium]|uniref:AAA family ATPase n=1 Tax=unclassified Janthinobacterium TaxID=2610881 RepID=UPI00088A5F58|nr:MULTISPECIES: AAA family ATPase [unclassified Janthinobacterium]SDA54196.1 exonuclease SbcC [Janthinobacterium sp. 551a]SFB45610.1 exonuclease SbcC [Janthinobacterium sp. 344]